MSVMDATTAVVSGVVPATDRAQLDDLAERATRRLGRGVTRSQVVAWAVAAAMGRRNPLFRPSGLLSATDAGLNLAEPSAE